MCSFSDSGNLSGRFWTAAFVAALSCLLIFCFASTASAAIETSGQFSSSLLDKLTPRLNAAGQRAHTAALSLFAALFLCQFAWSIAQVMLSESGTFAAVITTVIRQLLLGGFFYWLALDRTILHSIWESFETLGSTGLNYGDLLFLAEQCVGNIMRAVQGKGGLSLDGIALFFTGLAACIIMSYALTTAVGYMLLIQIESYIAATLGVILMGFGGADCTRYLSLSYIKGLVHIGFKYFLVSIMLTVGVTTFQQSTLGLGNAARDALIQTCMLLIGQSFLFLAIIRIIPQVADALISGGAINTAGAGWAVRSGAAAAAGMAITAGMGVLKAPMKAAETAQKTMDAASSFASSYSEKRTQGSSMTGAALGTMFSGIASDFKAHREQGMGSARAGINAAGLAVGKVLQNAVSGLDSANQNLRKNMGLEYQPTTAERQGHPSYPGDPKAYGAGEQNTMSAGQTQAAQTTVQTAQPTAQTTAQAVQSAPQTAAIPVNQSTGQASQSTRQKAQASPESFSSTFTTSQNSAGVKSASDGTAPNLSQAAQRAPTADVLAQRIRKERNA